MHFGDKEHLLTEIVMAIVTAVGDPVDDDIAKPGESDNLESDLCDDARRQLTAVLQPTNALRRLVRRGRHVPSSRTRLLRTRTGRTIAQLTTAIDRLARRGLLNVNDPTRAVSDLNWLIMSEPLNQAMLLGDNGPPDPASTTTWADQAVHTFLAAYGHRPK